MYSTMFLIACVIFMIAYVAFRETWHKKVLQEWKDFAFHQMDFAKHHRELLECAQVSPKCYVCGRYVAQDKLQIHYDANGKPRCKHPKCIPK